jgi:putative FmdB family regulatory protein
MPIYEYQCTQCEERFEVHQPMGADGSELHCPKCTTQNPKRVPSSFFSPTPSSTTSGPPEINPANPRRSRCGAAYRLEQFKKKKRGYRFSQ